MPRPKSKKELLEASQKKFKDLCSLLDSFSDQEIQKEFPEGTLNRNIRDVIAHLHFWHLMLFDWYEKGLQGIKPDMPAKGYTWKTMPELNKNIWEKSQSINLVQARQLLNQSFQKSQEIINKHSDKELFEKKKYAWTGSTSLAAYLIQNTSSHYAWAIKLIKKGMKP